MEKKYWRRRKDEDLLSRLVPFSLLGRLCRREKRSCSMDKMEIASILIEWKERISPTHPVIGTSRHLVAILCLGQATERDRSRDGVAYVSWNP